MVEYPPLDNLWIISGVGSSRDRLWIGLGCYVVKREKGAPYASDQGDESGTPLTVTTHGEEEMIACWPSPLPDLLCCE
jgi:hypothetical protein